MSWFGDQPWVRHGHETTPKKTEATHNTHHPSSSSDFGDYHSAPGSTFHFPGSTDPAAAAGATAGNAPSTSLDDNDLLISFDDEAAPAQQQAPLGRTQSQYQAFDLLTQEPGEMGASPQTRDSHGTAPTARNASDSSPSRQRHPFSSPLHGPSSPPRVSSAGSDIIFQAPQRSGKGDATTEFRRIRRMSDQYAMSGQAPSTRSRSTEESPTRSRSIAETLAVSKLANRWKRSVLQNQNVFGDSEPPTKTAQPIDISHSSPFAMKDQIAGAYVAPDGAPGFAPTTNTSRWDETNEWANTKLVGRRETTAAVLSQAESQALRPHLPARQRLSDSWTLLFSLDQHGASLSTLYRLVEQYARDHRNTGNVLVVRDGQGHTFGIYVNEPIAKREGTYYGSGEAFMYKFVKGESSPRVFPWTGRNQYIALCEASFISFGGGGTSYGLLLDSTFYRNSSATSPAFQNEVLCGGPVMSETGVPFDCLGLEVWATS